jgi:CMP-N-acetylneuraminic acid synthetase
MQTKEELKGKHVVCVIIARGGSRRLPRKNVLPFCGFPLVSWSIVQAKTSHLITDVYLSTDDQEIADIGETFGAEIIWRTKELAELTAGPSYIHALDNIKHPVDIYFALLPTAPTRPVYDMDEAVVLYCELKRKFGDILLAPLIPQLETVVYKKINRYEAEICLWDKNWNYLEQGGAWNVVSEKRYRQTSQFTQGKTDKEMDKWYSADVSNMAEQRIFFYPLETWQIIDIDMRAHFELSELLMEYYVLKGKGMDVFYEYGSSNNR